MIPQEEAGSLNYLSPALCAPASPLWFCYAMMVIVLVARESGKQAAILTTSLENINFSLGKDILHGCQECV